MHLNAAATTLWERRGAFCNVCVAPSTDIKCYSTTDSYNLGTIARAA